MIWTDSIIKGDIEAGSSCELVMQSAASSIIQPLLRTPPFATENPSAGPDLPFGLGNA